MKNQELTIELNPIEIDGLYSPIRANQALQDLRFAHTRLENAANAYVLDSGENLCGSWVPKIQEAMDLVEEIIKGGSATPKNIIKRSGGWMRVHELTAIRQTTAR